MKVSEIEYKRVEAEAVEKILKSAAGEIKDALSADKVLEARERAVKAIEEFSTYSALSYMRYTINTADEFYCGEKEYYDEAEPRIQTAVLEYNRAMLASPFRKELEEKLSPVLFRDMEVS